MLRLLALVLLLANALYFSWAQGLLSDFGLAPAQQSEPARLVRQIHPESIRILDAAEFKRLQDQALADAAPKECLQAGPFDAAQSDVLRKSLEAVLPAGSWDLISVALPPRWIVYMGKYPNADTVAKKRAEIAAMNLKIEALGNPALEPGFSLGSFGTQAQAEENLAQLSKRGIHTAHVVQEFAGGNAFTLKLPALTETLKGKLGDLKPALNGKVLSKC